jgi:hypothetical protein
MTHAKTPTIYGLFYDATVSDHTMNNKMEGMVSERKHS